MKEFTVKSYPKSELAQLYFPYSDAKFYSAKSVRCIVHFLGEP